MKSFYKIPESIKNDIALYRENVQKFLKGKIHPTQFRGQRVPIGVYEQRINNTYMMRVRIPAGGITPDQMAGVAELGKKYGNGILHMTTRQDIQIHRVRLEDTPEIMDGLLKIGLTTKGGGGNTVRNITACCDSGVCEEEIFDVSPFAIALTEHMIKDQRSYLLPRKFKIAFSGCKRDCAYATVNDVGFIGAEREIDGKNVKGFRVYAAGGMGASSKAAQKLEDFITLNEAADVCDAIKRVFDKNGNRKNRHKARLRFLIEELGKNEFIKRYRQELELIKKDGGTILDIKDMKVTPSAVADGSKSGKPAEPRNDRFDKWIKQNISPQRQKGYHSVKIRLPLGDIPSDILLSLAGLVEKYGEGAIRASQDQNLLLRWVHESELTELFAELNKINIPLTGAPVRDIVCCAGASTCRPGICLSRGMAEAVSSEFEGQNMNLDLLNDVQIKISGCPNACGQHPIAHIGLFGAARRVGEKLAPYYTIMLGGRVEEGKTAPGENIGISHAKNTPKIISEFLDYYTENAERFSDFYEYIEKDGKELMIALLNKYSAVPSYEEDKNYYIDWGAGEEFSLAGRGPGECGAGVFDMIEVDLNEARVSVDSALHSENPAPYLYQAINRSSRALLVTRGVEAKSDIDVYECFEKEFIKSGLVNSRFAKLMFMAAEYKKGNLRDQALMQECEAVKELVSDVRTLYNAMDDSLQFKKPIEKKSQNYQDDNKAQENFGIEAMDLRGVKCPFNYVKAKLKLETMDIGENVEFYLDDGEPIRNVPNSLKNDGQKILKMEKTDDGYYRLMVKKNC